MKENLKTLSSSDKMTNEISALSLVESFLDEYYLFRRNVLSGKTEYFTLSKNEDETEEPVEEEPETGGEEEESSDSTWKVLTPEAFNSIVRHAKRLGVGGKKSPRQDIEEFVRSEEVPEFDPIREYLENLPEWDGKNHVAELFGRIPWLTSEQLGWCATWLRSAVAHWLQMGYVSWQRNHSCAYRQTGLLQEYLCLSPAAGSSAPVFPRPHQLCQ